MCHIARICGQTVRSTASTGRASTVDGVHRDGSGGSRNGCNVADNGLSGRRCGPIDVGTLEKESEDVVVIGTSKTVVFKASEDIIKRDGVTLGDETKLYLDHVVHRTARPQLCQHCGEFRVSDRNIWT